VSIGSTLMMISALRVCFMGFPLRSLQNAKQDLNKEAIGLEQSDSSGFCSSALLNFWSFALAHLTPVVIEPLHPVVSLSMVSPEFRVFD